MKYVIAALAIVATAACGGGSGGSTAPTPVTPPATPAAAITATGAGALVLHPSARSSWTFSLYTPIRIQETASGTATWNYARFAMFKNGIEIERGELGADIISSPPSWANIAAQQNETYALIFGYNSMDFDTIVLTLGFSDKKDGRQFTVQILGSTFDGVDVSLTPLSRPVGVHRL